MSDRQAALAVLRAYVNTFDESPADILSSEASAAAEALQAFAVNFDSDIEAAHLLGWYHYLRYAVLPEGQDADALTAAMRCLDPVFCVAPEQVPEPLRLLLEARSTDNKATDIDHQTLANRAIAVFGAYERTGRLDLLRRAVENFRAALVSTPADEPTRAARLSDLGIALRVLFQQTGELAALTESVEVSREAVDTEDAPAAGRAVHLNNLGGALQALFETTGALDLVDEAVRVGRRAVQATPGDNPNRPTFLTNLGNALHTWFGQTGDVRSLAEAVQVGREAVAATPEGHAHRAAFLTNLGNALQTLFSQTGQVATLVEAVQVKRQAVEATPPDHAVYIVVRSSLGTALRELYDETGDVQMLIEAIEISGSAAESVPVGHPSRAAYLEMRARMLRMLSERTGQVEVLVEAVRVGRQAVDETPVDHPSRSGLLSSLGDTLLVLFERTGQLEVLEEAVRVGRRSLEDTAADHVDRASRMSNLGMALGALFARTGRLDVLTEAVTVSGEAVDAMSADQANYATALGSLGTKVLALFKRTGQPELLAEAVRLSRKALDATPAGHPRRPGRLHNLGDGLLRQFRQTGELETLNEAVRVARLALQETPADHPDRAVLLAGLGLTLQAQFERAGALEVLAEAVRIGREALDATPADHPDLPGRLNTLAVALQASYERGGQAPALPEALRISRRALDLLPAGHPHRPGHLSNLGNSLRMSFKQTGRIEQLAEAVEAARESVQATPPDHPDRALFLNNVGIALEELYKQTHEWVLLDEAKRGYHEAAYSPTGATLARITACRQLAKIAGGEDDGEAGLTWIELAIELVAAFASDGLAHEDRVHQLGRVAYLAGDAAAAALTAGRPARAVELLERTRGVLAADALGLRSEDHRRLRRQYPELAARLERLRALRSALDQSDSAGSASLLGIDDADIVRQGEQHLAERRRQAAEAWQELLDEIRAAPGFADFFRPVPIATLAGHAHAGPVVYITTSDARADALILTDGPDPVRHVPLSALTDDAVRENAGRLLRAGRTVGSPAADPTARQGAQREVFAVLGWLWDTIAEPVLTHLGLTDPVDGEHPPRIWWCPVGVLALLPLHAAGHYAAGLPEADPSAAPAPPRTVPDLVVSSYCPTVRALPSAPYPERADAPTTVLVCAAEIPGRELAGAVDEVSTISDLIDNVRVLDQPTRDEVLASLPSFRLAHFSCHGYVNWAHPAISSLVLTDHATTPLTLTDITALRLDADLAYLSACETFVAAPRLADESLHITGAFQLAGYRHVIGTLWRIGDRAAAQLAEAFYRDLTTDGVPHPDRAAHALHHATMRLRTRYPAVPTLWAGHTHTGA